MYLVGMLTKKTLYFFGAVALPLFCDAQSPLVEPSHYEATFYVTPNGSPYADGLSREDGVTLQRGLELARDAISEGAVKIVVTAGVHRQGRGDGDFLAQIDFFERNTEPRFPGDPEALATTEPHLLTIEGEGAPEEVVIAGSKILPGPWTPEGDAYYTTWEEGYGSLDLANTSPWFANLSGDDIARFNRCELIFVNGIRLRQVFQQSDLIRGTFFVDESASRLYVEPVSGTAMGNALVESGHYKFLLDIRRKNNLIVRGLTFRHAAGWFSNGGSVSGAAIYIGGYSEFAPSDALIEDVIVEWNGAAGLAGFYRNFTFRNVINRHNGMIGFNFSGEDGLIEDCANYGNNWKGAESSFFDNVVGGIKVGHLYNSEIVRLDSSRNFGKGLWLDVFCRDVTIRDSTFNYNQMGEGIYFEIFQGGGLVENCEIRYNGSYGVLGVQAEAVTLRDNSIIGNSRGQIKPNTGAPRGGTYVDFPTNETKQTNALLTRDWVVENNNFVLAHPRQAFWLRDGNATWEGFADSLQVSGNDYFGFNPHGFLSPAIDEPTGTLDDWHNWEPNARLLSSGSNLQLLHSGENTALYQIWGDYSGEGALGSYDAASRLVDVQENRPSKQIQLPWSAAITDFSSRFTHRLRTYVEIPEDGVYHFAVTSNAETQLLINTAGASTPLNVIATVPEPLNHSDELRPHQYHRWPSQTSHGLTLSAGQTIYFEALATHSTPRPDLGGALPHLSIAWTRPDGASAMTYRHAHEEVPAAYLDSRGLHITEHPLPSRGVTQSSYGSIAFSSGNPPLVDLLTSEHYPTSPLTTATLPTFESLPDNQTLGGSRYRAWLEPEVSGAYTFWIASNGISELWLSSDTNPQNAQRISHVPSFTNYREWDRHASQQSATVDLVAGVRYFIEAHYLYRFNMHFSVAWTLPDDPSDAPSEVIPGRVLVPYVAPESAWNQISTIGVRYPGTREMGGEQAFYLGGSSDNTSSFPGATMHYQRFLGDGVLQCELTQLYSPSSAAMAGLFIRNDWLDPFGLALTVNQAGQLLAHARSFNGGAFSTTLLHPNVELPVHLRLNREGTTLFLDVWNTNETYLNQHTVVMSALYDEVLAGVFVDSDDPGIRAHAAFDLVASDMPSLTNLAYDQAWVNYSFAAHPSGTTGNHTLHHADANHDGLSNLFDYAQLRKSDGNGDRIIPLLLEPLASGAGELIAIRTIKGGSGALESGYEVAGIRYLLETSTSLDPSSWISAEGHVTYPTYPILYSTDNHDGTQTVRLMAIPSAHPEEEGERFFRLRVTLAP